MILNGLRLSLVQDAAQGIETTFGTAIYAVPTCHGMISLWNGSAWQVAKTNVPLVLQLSSVTTVAGEIRDIFATLQSDGTPAISFGEPWSGGVRSVEGLQSVDGVWVSSFTPLKRYLGTVRINSNNFLSDNSGSRLLWNYYNQIELPLSYVEAASASWTYASATIRSAKGTGTSAFDLVLGFPTVVFAELQFDMASSAGSGVGLAGGIGVDSTTAFSTRSTSVMSFTDSYTAGVNNTQPVRATYSGILSLGAHTFYWLEACPGAFSCTGYGTHGLVAGIGSFMRGKMMG